MYCGVVYLLFIGFGLAIGAEAYEKIRSLCPPYQHHGDLLHDFSLRLRHLIETHAYRSDMGLSAMQVIFDFCGEYSVVAEDYDILRRKMEVDSRVHGVVNIILAATGLTFGPRIFYIRSTI
jgi:hypothetical protein